MKWDWADVEVDVEYDDFERAREEAIKLGKSTDVLTVPASVLIDDVLEEATVEQLRDAIGREAEGYTPDQLDAITDCFAAVASGEASIAICLLGRVFEYEAQIRAAENGLRASYRRAA